MTKRSRQQGELESAVLDALWDAHPAGRGLNSQEILEAVNEATDSELALTTVLTVLSRLLEKGLVERNPASGRGFLFKATSTREQHTAAMLLEIVAGSDNPALAFSHFTSGLSPEALKALRQSLPE